MPQLRRPPHVLATPCRNRGFLQPLLAAVVLGITVSSGSRAQETPAGVASDERVVISDNLVPGEAAPPPTRSHDEHPWTIMERQPAVTDPRAAVEPEKLDSPRSLM